MNTDTQNTVPAKKTPPPLGSIRPSLCFYHANPKGTGSALKMNLHPAHDYTDGCIMLKIANQMTVGNPMGPNPTFATFDWENAMNVKLDFSDLCQMLQVFRGECESINGEKGLYHRSPVGQTSIRLKHTVDPVPGYLLEIYRSSRKGAEADGHADTENADVGHRIPVDLDGTAFSGHSVTHDQKEEIRLLTVQIGLRIDIGRT